MSEDKPEVSNLTPSELQNELQTWSSHHGTYEEMKNGMPFYRIRHYPTAMNAFIVRLLEIGYNEKQIRSEYLSITIQRFCTSHRHPNRKAWMIQIGRHWDFAVNARFPATEKVTEAKPIENRIATQTIEDVKPKKEIQKLDMSKHIGFGKPMRRDKDEDILAGLDGDSDE